MSKRQVVNELHRSARKNFNRRRVIIKGLDDLWQADLVEMGAYVSDNTGFRFLLTIIDTFSKFAWTASIKTKTGKEVAIAIEQILQRGRIPKNLQTDDGKEFYNKHFKNVMTKYQINHYSTYSPLKASIVERFNRTLKNMMWKEFSMNGNYKWINQVDDIVDAYNNKKHRTIKMAPSAVNSSNEKLLLSTVYNNIKVMGPFKYNVGDHVRISKYKHVFEKGYTPNWTTEIFKIREIRITNPVTYLLEDYEGNKIEGGFYEPELLKAEHPSIYLVEKILKRNGNQAFVKWLGFSTKHNSWINTKDMIY